MSIVKSARTWTEMTQPQFSEYLSALTGMSIRFQNVSAWERGVRPVPAKVRNVCLESALRQAIIETDVIISDANKISAICERLRG